MNEIDDLERQIEIARSLGDIDDMMILMDRLRIVTIERSLFQSEVRNA